jgi:hypothetical protein
VGEGDNAFLTRLLAVRTLCVPRPTTREVEMSVFGARNLLVLGCLSAVVVGYIVITHDDDDPGATSASFTISGDTDEPISPGVAVPLDLELSNPHDLPMSVTAVAVTMTAVSAPLAHGLRTCSMEDFSVHQVSPTVEITLAAQTTGTLSSLGIAPTTWPQVGMLDRSINQDGCKGASLALAYTATGTLAD